MNIQCAFAKSLAERKRALSIVHDAYVAKGYIQPQPNGYYETTWHRHPETKIINVQQSGHVIFTVTIVPDCGQLQTEDAYPEAVAMARKNFRLAEMICFAAPLKCNSCLVARTAVCEIVRFLGKYGAGAGGFQALLQLLHPHHAKVYRRIFPGNNVEVIGSGGVCRAINGHPPAEALLYKFSC